MKNNFYWTFRYFKEFKNPISVLLFKIGIKNESIVKFKRKHHISFLRLNENNKDFLNYYTMILSNDFDIKKENLFWNVMDQVIKSKEIIDFDGIKIVKDNLKTVFIEYFSKYYYTDLVSVNNRVVIDIGGNIGDSALIFANNGATVYAFEAIPDLYEIALENIKLNPHLKYKIQFYNEAVSSKKKKLKIFYEKDNNGASSSSYINKGNLFEIESTTIPDIINKHDIKPDILKLDCEGCEFEIILNTDLSNFNEIVLEHHAKIVKKSYKLLVDKLKEQGFKVKCISTSNNPFKDIGIIYAYKTNK